MSSHAPCRQHRACHFVFLRHTANYGYCLLSLLLISALMPSKASAFLYPYDFGSYSDQPRAMVNNAALLYRCEPSITLAGRLRSNEFQPRSSEAADSTTDPTDGNAIEAEAGFCHHELEWLTLGAFSAFSSFDSKLSTRSETNPIVFPLQKTYLPVISGGFAVTVIDNFHLGFAAQFFETVEIDTRISISNELRATVETRISMAFNWNLGAALETDFGIFHGGYQPAFEADVDFSVSAPIDLSALNLPLSLELTDLFSLEGALDYRPATWQFGWIGKFDAHTVEIGGLISEWDRLGAGTFITLNDTFGLTDLIFNRNEITLKKTLSPYIVVQTKGSESLTLQAGYAFFSSPLEIEDSRRWAIAGDIHSVKGGFKLKSQFRGRVIYLEGQLIYGHMADQEVSNGGYVSGQYISGMGQISFPF